MHSTKVYKNNYCRIKLICRIQQKIVHLWKSVEFKMTNVFFSHSIKCISYLYNINQQEMHKKAKYIYSGKQNMKNGCFWYRINIRNILTAKMFPFECFTISLLHNKNKQCTVISVNKKIMAQNSVMLVSHCKGESSIRCASLKLQHKM